MKKFIVIAVVLLVIAGGYYVFFSGKVLNQNNANSGANAGQQQGNSLDAEPGQVSNLPKKALKVTTLGGAVHEFDVEVAENDEDRKQGLMYRKSMAQNQGMLFIFEKADIQYFWMKNTLLSLDIIFVDEGGKVVQVAHNAQPCFEKHCDLYSSMKLARYVLEINGGLANSLGLKEGDTVTW
jgi:uncharacterized membrane protein (UPF0127 family)